MAGDARHKHGKAVSRQCELPQGPLSSAGNLGVALLLNYIRLREYPPSIPGRCRNSDGKSLTPIHERAGTSWDVSS
jgi:hypothetical protein